MPAVFRAQNLLKRNLYRTSAKHGINIAYCYTSFIFLRNGCVEEHMFFAFVCKFGPNRFE